jgi:hypothetical protein
MPDHKMPTGFGTEGRRLWHWMSVNFSMAGAEPMCEELCRLCDRLASVRKEIAKAPDDMRLVSAEMKATAAFARAWKMLGLADADAKGRPGYPAGVPRRRAS